MRLILFSVLIICSTISHAATILCQSSSKVYSESFTFKSVGPEIILKTQVTGLAENVKIYARADMVCGTPINFASRCSSKEDPILAKTIGAKYLFSFSCDNGIQGNVTFEEGNVATLECGRLLPQKIVGNCTFNKE